MLKKIVNEKQIQAKAAIGFYPCNSNDEDDIEIYDPTNPDSVIAKFATLRQ